MLFQIRQILDKKKKMIARLSLVGALLVTLSPLLSAMTQGNQENFLEGVNYTLATSDFTAATGKYHFASVDGVIDAGTIDAGTTDGTNVKKESAVAIATTITTAPHCSTMTHNNDCYNVVCCSSLIYAMTPVQVYPDNKVHKVFLSISNYLVTLPIEIKPPILTSV